MGLPCTSRPVQPRAPGTPSTVKRRIVVSGTWLWIPTSLVSYSSQSCAPASVLNRWTFVTPAFPGYVSGHSTFSRAAAVVLATLTGSDFFPGGYGSYRLEPGYLFFERGPSAPVELGFATYFDAADQAGQSRIWGGIHVSHDDFDGRRTGAIVGALAVERAQAYFDGTAD